MRMMVMMVMMMLIRLLNDSHDNTAFASALHFHAIKLIIPFVQLLMHIKHIEQVSNVNVGWFDKLIVPRERRRVYALLTVNECSISNLLHNY